MENKGYCPVCHQVRESLPKPAEGSCAWCFNHLMHIECKDCLDINKCGTVECLVQEKNNV